MRSDGMRRIGDVAEVGFMVLIERSGNADDDGVHLLQLRVVGGGRETLRFGGLNFVSADAIDVGSTLRQSIDLALIDVEAGDQEFLLGKEQSEWEPHVPQADDSDARLALLDFVLG